MEADAEPAYSLLGDRHSLGVADGQAARGDGLAVRERRRHRLRFDVTGHESGEERVHVGIQRGGDEPGGGPGRVEVPAPRPRFNGPPTRCRRFCTVARWPISSRAICTSSFCTVCSAAVFGPFTRTE